jgi:hypothetical protein
VWHLPSIIITVRIIAVGAAIVGAVAVMIKIYKTAFQSDRERKRVKEESNEYRER